MQNRVTASQVAEKAGVSRSTVSFVLNNVPDIRIADETRLRVLNAAEALNYHPNASARRLVTGKTNLIAYVERQSPESITDGFWPELLRGIHDGALREEREVLFAPDAVVGGQGRCTRLLAGNHVDGAIISGPRNDDAELTALLEAQAPVVLQGTWHDDSVPAVDVDNVAAAEMATSHLLNLGHRRIGLILHAPTSYIAATERLAGYRRALERVGIQPDPTLISSGEFTPESGERAATKLLESESAPTALFATSDTVAIGAGRAVRRRGLGIPEDVALVGFNDSPLAKYVNPPLTSIRLPAYELGRRSVRLLIQLLRDALPEPPRIQLDSKLIVRRSCGTKRTTTGLVG